MQPTASSDSLEAVFGAEVGALVRSATGLCGRRDWAEEIVQDAFLKLHEQWADVENPRAWLFRCVRNLSSNRRRDEAREVLPDASVSAGEFARQLAGAFRPAASIGKVQVRFTLARKDRFFCFLKPTLRSCSGCRSCTGRASHQCLARRNARVACERAGGISNCAFPPEPSTRCFPRMVTPRQRPASRCV